MSDDILCATCGVENPKHALYCIGCGARLGGGNCQCGAEIPPGARHCPNCGGAVERQGAADVGRRADRRRDAGIRWVRGDRDVATRITPADLKGILVAGLEVQPGTRALFFVGGRYVATLPPGRHTLENLAQRWKFPTDGEPAAIVVDDGELGLELAIGDLHSADHHNVQLNAQASLRLAEPEVFIANMMRDRGRFTVGDLQEFLQLEVQRSLRELVARHPAEALYTGRASAELEMELLSRWRASLDRTGFTLNRFRVLDFVLPGLEKAEDLRSEDRDVMARWSAIREGKESYADAALSDLRFEGELAGRRREVEIDLEVQSLRRDTERLLRRNPQLEQFLSEQNVEKLLKCKSEADFREFWLPWRRQEILDDHEIDQFQKIAEAEGKQADEKRRWVTDRLTATINAELAELRLKQQIEMNLLSLRGETETRQEEARKMLAQLDGEVEARRRVLEQQLTEADRKFAQEIGWERSRAELQQERLERMEDMRQRSKDRDAARELQARIAVIQLENQRQATEMELGRGMSPEQWLSLAVARNPERAEEIAASFRAMKSGEASEIQKEMYERLVAEVKGVGERAQTLDHDKFRLSVDADARHRARFESLGEQEKDRAERISVAGLTADDKKSMQWLFCEIHQMKYVAAMGCPLCKASG